MLSAFVGPVDVPAAGVLIALVVAAAVVASTFLTVYVSRDKRAHDFTMAKLTLEADTSLKLANSNANHEATLARIAADRDVQFKRVDSGMIDVKAAEPRGYSEDTRNG